MFRKAVVMQSDASGSRGQQAAFSEEVHTMTKYQYARVDGYKIFYREAGSKPAPTILLLLSLIHI